MASRFLRPPHPPQQQVGAGAGAIGKPQPWDGEGDSKNANDKNRRKTNGVARKGQKTEMGLAARDEEAVDILGII
jgi:hypothetical protein